MKEKKRIFLYGIVAVCLAYGVFVTLQMRKIENRVRILEKHLAGVVALQASDFVVTLTNDHQIEVQGAKLNLEELKALISAIPNSSEKAATIIYGDAENIV